MIESPFMYVFYARLHHLGFRSCCGGEATLSMALHSMTWYDDYITARMLPERSLVVVGECDPLTDADGVAADVARQSPSRSLRCIVLPRHCHGWILISPWAWNRVLPELDAMFVDAGNS
eukprot:NODE_19035_length_863_cov_3.221467.p2 GENE.NODE_19035_length_863_cov_3.221467~~NODE_19035_length_863_cov_3.221467.p2  ORF type:complete len:119 (-),score=20.20 NODE_19035_length_863_cov_3.221467:413-769(-)